MIQFVHALSRRRAVLARWLLPLLLLAVGLCGAARAQDPAPFKDEELDQMLAPIALYPDSLLSQVLMASTYPADVKEAAAWVKAHPDDKGEAAVKKVESQAWEPAVKSLVAFPQVLTMMEGKPDNVQRLGDAFLAEPGRVMDRVQVLRKKAQEAGNLKSNEQQKVSNTTEESKQVIVIEPAQPESVYVPVYQPSVYGAWGYPAYPPYYWAPPPYYYPGGAFVAGVLWGAAIVGIGNALWGGCNWGGGNVNINVNKFNNVNVNNKLSANSNKFQHNSAGRRDVPYRDSKSREQFGSKGLEGAKDREAYRGKDGREGDRARAEDTLKSRGADPAAGREQLQGADRDRANAAARDTGAGAGNRDLGGADRAGASTGSRDVGGANRASAGTSATGSGSRDNSLSGVRDSGASRSSAGAQSSRGSASRSSMGGGGGGMRSGGGGGRR